MIVNRTKKIIGISAIIFSPLSFSTDISLSSSYSNSMNSKLITIEESTVKLTEDIATAISASSSAQTTANTANSTANTAYAGVKANCVARPSYTTLARSSRNWIYYDRYSYEWSGSSCVSYKSGSEKEER